MASKQENAEMSDAQDAQSGHPVYEDKAAEILHGILALT